MQISLTSEIAGS